jgi:hypothetical protein
MRTVCSSEPGDSSQENEDWCSAVGDVVVVLDGATSRTSTGCSHGVAWYVRNLGESLTSHANSEASLQKALSASIDEIRERHAECDLTHPGSPSAAVGILRARKDVVEVLVLADVSIVVEHISGAIEVFTDDRPDRTARPERDYAMSLPWDDPRRPEALVTMKRSMLAMKNTPGGYFVAAADPSVSAEAITAAFPEAEIRSVTLMTDGAARLSTQFGRDWEMVLSLIQESGPEPVIALTRSLEKTSLHSRRTKIHDDATMAYCSFREGPARDPGR